MSFHQFSVNTFDIEISETFVSEREFIFCAKKGFIAKSIVFAYNRQQRRHMSLKRGERMKRGNPMYQYAKTIRLKISAFIEKQNLLDAQILHFVAILTFLLHFYFYFFLKLTPMEVLQHTRPPSMR
jgi:hypothetical protein